MGRGSGPATRQDGPGLWRAAWISLPKSSVAVFSSFVSQKGAAFMREKHSHLRAEIAIVFVLIAMVSFATLRSSGEKKKWQAGTVLDVKVHHGESEAEDAAKQYDVSVKVGQKIYVALYAPEGNHPEPEFYVGMERNVLVDGDTLKFNDLQGRTHSMRILSSKDAPPTSAR